MKRSGATDTRHAFGVTHQPPCSVFVTALRLTATLMPEFRIYAEAIQGGSPPVWPSAKAEGCAGLKDALLIIASHDAEASFGLPRERGTPAGNHAGFHARRSP